MSPASIRYFAGVELWTDRNHRRGDLPADHRWRSGCSGDGARRRVGPPVVLSTVVIAFGEVVVMGEMVADGYLGADDAGFGLVTMPDGRRQRALRPATG